MKFMIISHEETYATFEVLYTLLNKIKMCITIVTIPIHYLVWQIDYSILHNWKIITYW